MNAKPTGRDALRARSQVVASAPAPATVDTPAPAAVPAPRTHPIKMTLDLSPVDHRHLRRWCTEAADELGLSGVAAAEVVRVLLRMMHNDRALADRVRASLARSGGTLRT